MLLCVIGPPTPLARRLLRGGFGAPAFADLTGVSELIYFEQYCGQLFATSPLCQWQWLLLVGLLSIPVLQERIRPPRRRARRPRVDEGGPLPGPPPIRARGRGGCAMAAAHRDSRCGRGAP
jgi:hypothetical protein